MGLTGEFEGWGAEPDQELGTLSESTKCFHRLYWPLYSGAAQNHCSQWSPAGLYHCQVVV
jgi:hypothetical protein